MFGVCADAIVHTSEPNDAFIMESKINRFWIKFRVKNMVCFLGQSYYIRTGFELDLTWIIFSDSDSDSDFNSNF